MKKSVFNIKSRISYFVHKRHRQGHGVHSPYVFYFLNEVLFEKRAFYCYNSLECVRESLLSDRSVLSLPTIGTGEARKEQVRQVARRSLKSKRYAQLLFRIAEFSKAETIVELGTSLGLTSLYLASGKKDAKVYTFEGAEALEDRAEQLFYAFPDANIELVKGNIDDTLAPVLDTIDHVDMAFIDANHTYEATMHYFDLLARRCHSQSIVVIDDIHWSSDMQRAWLEISARLDIRLSIDIFGMGIVFFNTDLPKQSYIVAF